MKNRWKTSMLACGVGKPVISLERTSVRRIVLNVGLWIALALAASLGSLGDMESPSMFWRLVGVVLLVPVVLLRHRWLLMSWCLSAVLSLIDPWFSFSIFTMSYLVGRRDVRERPVEVATAAAVVLTAMGVIGTTAGHFTTWLNAAPLLVGVVTAWLAGRYSHQRRELELAGWQHAQHLEREQQLIADRARIRERDRIAQDMHDQLGHDLTLIAMQAAALEVSPHLDESARSTAGELRRSTALAVERLSEIIGVLHVDMRQEEPSPREDLMTIVDRARTAGMLIEFRRTGLDIMAPPVIEGTVRRILQESLTNAAKHAPGTKVVVRVERSTDRTVVTITNAVSGQLPRQAGGNGMGLVGLSERVRILGGALTAGHDGDGCFEVSARLPHLVDRSASGDEADSVRVPVTFTAQLHAERRVRRSLFAVLAVPVAVAAVLGVIIFGYFSRAFDSVTLDADTYTDLRVGQRWGDLRSLFPPQQAHIDRDAELVPAPSRSSCRYYRADGGGFFFMEDNVYRVCFIDGSLVSKSELTTHQR